MVEFTYFYVVIVVLRLHCDKNQSSWFLLDIRFVHDCKSNRFCHSLELSRYEKKTRSYFLLYVCSLSLFLPLSLQHFNNRFHTQHMEWMAQRGKQKKFHFGKETSFESVDTSTRVNTCFFMYTQCPNDLNPKCNLRWSKWIIAGIINKHWSQ